MKRPDVVKALTDWRDRLARLDLVTETAMGTPSPVPNRTFTPGPFTPPSEPELVGKSGSRVYPKRCRRPRNHAREFAWQACPSGFLGHMVRALPGSDTPHPGVARPIQR